jgi:serine/threonine protein kinase
VMKSTKYFEQVSGSKNFIDFAKRKLQRLNFKEWERLKKNNWLVNGRDWQPSLDLEDRVVEESMTIKSNAENEYKILKKLKKTPPIYVTRTAQDESKKIIFLLEYAPGISVKDAFQMRQPGNSSLSIWSEKVWLQITLGLLNEIRQIHEAGILHCDISTGNFMVHVTEESIVTVKAIDFGLSKIVSDKKLLSCKASYRGTKSFVAPEIKSGQYNTYNEATEIYALGVILAKIWGGNPTLSSQCKKMCSNLSILQNWFNLKKTNRGTLNEAIEFFENQLLQALLTSENPSDKTTSEKPLDKTTSEKPLDKITSEKPSDKTLVTTSNRWPINKILNGMVFGFAIAGLIAGAILTMGVLGIIIPSVLSTVFLGVGAAGAGVAGGVVTQSSFYEKNKKVITGTLVVTGLIIAGILTCGIVPAAAGVVLGGLAVFGALFGASSGAALTVGVAATITAPTLLATLGLGLKNIFGRLFKSKDNVLKATSSQEIIVGAPSKPGKTESSGAKPSQRKSSVSGVKVKSELEEKSIASSDSPALPKVDSSAQLDPSRRNSLFPASPKAVSKHAGKHDLGKGDDSKPDKLTRSVP